MNKDSFISAVRNPNQTPVDLETIVQTFPYFQSARLLASKASTLSNNHLSEQFLRTAAAFSVDRVRLHDLVHSVAVPSEKETSEVVNEPKLESQVYLPEFSEEMVEPEPKRVEEIIEARKLPEVKIEELKETEDSDLLKEFMANMESMKAAKKLAQTNLSKLLDTKEPLQKEEIKVPAKPVHINTPLFKVNTFVAPIDYKNQELYDGRVGESLGSAGQIEILQQYLSFLKRRKSIKEDDQLAVIENFIKRNPTISKPTEAGLAMNKADFSQQSTKETHELVTENLANIFVKQKKYSKAIEIYQKLSLKYPEKSTYFAQKITELQNL